MAARLPTPDEIGAWGAAFGSLEQAVERFGAMGKDPTEVEGILRRCIDISPVFAASDDTDVWLARYEALKTMPYAEYLATPEWAEQRRRARQRAGGRCQGCSDTRHLETHHVTYDNRGHEEPEDLTVLCAACHTAVHLVADGRRGKVRADSRRART